MEHCPHCNKNGIPSKYLFISGRLSPISCKLCGNLSVINIPIIVIFIYAIIFQVLIIAVGTYSFLNNVWLPFLGSVIIVITAYYFIAKIYSFSAISQQELASRKKHNPKLLIFILLCILSLVFIEKYL